ncbi:hypothetical protein [Escherichia coli]|uniref:hypothetical protein n=1 Tax=Escherichia coli TaxID=562 RepID=UPI00331318A4
MICDKDEAPITYQKDGVQVNGSEYSKTYSEVRKIKKQKNKNISPCMEKKRNKKTTYYLIRHCPIMDLSSK